MKILKFTFFIALILGSIYGFTQTHLDSKPGFDSIQPIAPLPGVMVTGCFGWTSGSAEDQTNDNLNDFPINKYSRKIEFFIPNAFTPNNDGLNDEFKIFCKGCKIEDLKIYDMLGNLKFKTKDPRKGWDGTFNDDQCKAGVYICIINYKDENGELQNKLSSITLIK